MKLFITNLVYKIYIQLVFPIAQKPVEYVSTFFALFGGCYTLSEIMETVFESQFLIDYIKDHRGSAVLLAVVLTVLLHKEKSDCTAYLGSKDTKLCLKLSNILYLKDTAIVIPTNTTFDTIMEDDFISPKSIQGQFQKRYYNRGFESLDKQLNQSIEKCYPQKYSVLQDRINSNIYRYDIGTVAKITKNGQHFYFLAVADVNRVGKTENVTMHSLNKALNGFWNYYAMNGHNEPIAIPVIGTGKGGLFDGSLEDVIHETIVTFANESQKRFVAKGMTVCVYPPSLKKANVTWKSLCEFLEWICRFSTQNEKTKDTEQV